mmetsp:Transcript_31287/g.68350  ORF Transcript_31287/g.68350 Transcript_31287/m.68350 type:complete len:405 (+) Transcript_31287:296-1510(+)
MLRGRQLDRRQRHAELDEQERVPRADQPVPSGGRRGSAFHHRPLGQLGRLRVPLPHGAGGAGVKAAGGAADGDQPQPQDARGAGRLALCGGARLAQHRLHHPLHHDHPRLDHLHQARHQAAPHQPHQRHDGVHPVAGEGPDRLHAGGDGVQQGEPAHGGDAAGEERLPEDHQDDARGAWGGRADHPKREPPQHPRGVQPHDPGHPHPGRLRLLRRPRIHRRHRVPAGARAAVREHHRRARAPGGGGLRGRPQQERGRRLPVRVEAPPPREGPGGRRGRRRELRRRVLLHGQRPPLRPGGDGRRTPLPQAGDARLGPRPSGADPGLQGEPGLRAARGVGHRGRHWVAPQDRPLLPLAARQPGLPAGEPHQDVRRVHPFVRRLRRVLRAAAAHSWSALARSGDGKG